MSGKPTGLVAGWRSRLAAFLLFAAALVPAIAFAGVADVRRALEAVAGAIAATQNGNHGAARDALQGVAPIVHAERSAIAAFDARAGEAWNRCVAAVAQIDRELGEIAATGERVARELGETERALNAAVNDGAVLAQEIGVIQERMRQLDASVQARQAKLRELEKWWWVPGYGAYLGIRTLAENDVGQLHHLARSLQDERVQLGRSAEALAAARAAMARLANEQSRLNAERDIAVALHGDLVARMTRTRDVTDFIGQAKDFWGDVNSLLESQVQGAIGTTTTFANRLAATMGRPGPEALVLGIGKQQVNLRAQLVELAGKLEQGQGYTALAATDCAPGAGARAANVRACQISVAWPHYEVIDPASCSFRYINPPGCPPAVAVPPPPGNPMEANWRNLARAQKEGVLGRVAEERNWIGLSRCRSPDALFLGIQASPAACAAACRDHDACYAWTFNTNNGMIADTVHECWGGTNNLALTPGPWGGFVSGGMPCARGEACQ